MVSTCRGANLAKLMRWCEIFFALVLCSCCSQKVRIQENQERLLLDEFSLIRIECAPIVDSIAAKVYKPVANPFAHVPQKVTITATRSRSVQRERVERDSTRKDSSPLVSVPASSIGFVHWLLVCVVIVIFFYFLRTLIKVGSRE